MNYNEIINFKWGSKPQRNIERKSLAKKWLFCKPDIGNLSSAPQTPFNSFTSNPYYGGYPTGNSIYEYCAWSTPKHIKDKRLKGITHFAYSGCGDLNNFYNYFLIKPSKNNYYVNEEKYRINGYFLRTDGYSVDCIINQRSVKYSIKSLDEVILIPGFSGLTTDKYKSAVCNTIIEEKDKCICCYVSYKIIDLFWSIKILEGTYKIQNNKIILSKDCVFILGYSKDCFEDAIESAADFKEDEADKKWNKVLNAFEVEDCSDYNKLFFTSLYFALKKPFIYSEKEVYDYSTMWDIYKTLLPLIFMFYKDKASIICNHMLTMINKDGKFYHCSTLSKFEPLISEQAICLMNISLSTAHIYGVEFDYELAKELQKNEINYYLNNLDKLSRTTYYLDLCDAIVAYYNAYGIDLGLDKIEKFINKVFDSKKVYLDKSSTYYEGNVANYSFRVSCSTHYRIQEKESLNKELDKFFGFKGSDSFRFVIPTNPIIVKNYVKTINRFEGLNNEPDMESMYLYSYINEYEKQNKVIYDVITNSFNLTERGVPGNDDNGGLSGWLVWNLIGLFPVVGTNKFRIGLPMLKNVKIGNLTIISHKLSDDSIEYDKVLFNGLRLNQLEISVKDVDNGGTLEIFLK